MAALALLAGAEGRRIAVLGDMLELGTDGAAHHAGLAAAIEAAKADLVFLNGTEMQALWGRPAGVAARRLGADLCRTCPKLAAALKLGDTVLVKGSLGSKMAVIVDALKARGA
ncbi:MAG: hypothetical protein WDN08_13795 [Rhizomicrobium sp.]